MLLQNITLGAQSPIRTVGSTTVNTTVGNARSQLGLGYSVSFLSPFASEAGWEDTSSVPNGWAFGNGWMPPKAGGGIWVANVGQSTIAGSGTLSPTGRLGKNAAAELSGSGTISNASASLILSAIATLAGTGTLSAAVFGGLNAVAALSGSGTLAGALGAIARAVSTLAGSGTVSAGSSPSAIAQAVASIVVTGAGLSTANVGSAVWAALAAANDTAGSMGEKLNDAGSASNPWTEVIESGYTAAEVLRLILAAASNSATGLESGAPVFKSIDETKDRITATYAAGTRTVTDRDVT